MSDPTLSSYTLCPPHAMSAQEFASWESINRPRGRYLLRSFRAEGEDTMTYAPGDPFDEGDEARHPRWVCVYEVYDEVTWGLIND